MKIKPGCIRVFFLTEMLVLGAAAQSSPVLRMVHVFEGGPNDGQFPYAGLVRSGKVFYGTTLAGGNGDCPSGCGAVFSLTEPESATGHWTETILYNFHGSDGNAPYAGLVVGHGVLLYGTTGLGGSENLGTAFSLAPPSTPGGAWTETVLHNFGKDHDGANPEGGLKFGHDGALYGTTAYGGRFRYGTVFKLIPPSSEGGAWIEEVLCSFTGGDDGSQPLTALTINPSDGTLYGTTNGGGTAFDGTVFSLAPPLISGSTWTETVIQAFTDGDDGIEPNALLLRPGGVIYGTSHGTQANYGAVFSLTPPASPGGPWTFAALHDFRGSPDGSEPDAGLIMGSDGTLYGTTVSGGTDNQGVVFSMTPPAAPGGAWTETVLYSLSVGNSPTALTFGETEAELFGTTKFGGAFGFGTAYALALQ
jgi:uncharacterized repeat protein (TIGR03803 family)